MSEDIKNFLDKIKELKEDKIKVYVNSLGKKIDVDPLSFKQQKDIISTIADGNTAALKFQKVLNDVVLSNSSNTNLKITDRLAIVLALRSNSIGYTVKLKDKEICIWDVIKNSERPVKFEQLIISDAVTVVLDVPSLKEENKIINSCIDAVKKTGTEVSKSIGDLYTYEIVKFVKEIQFDENVLTFSDLSVKDRLEVVNNLPLSINRKIVDYIQSIKKWEYDILTVDIDGDTYHIDIDVTFFDS
jgi:hypothetical protein